MWVKAPLNTVGLDSIIHRIAWLQCDPKLSYTLLNPFNPVVLEWHSSAWDCTLKKKNEISVFRRDCAKCIFRGLYYSEIPLTFLCPPTPPSL